MKNEEFIIIASLQNQDLRIRVGLDTSLGSLIALMTFLALFSTLGTVTIEIVFSSLIGGLTLFLNVLYCFGNMGVKIVKMDKNFDSECAELLRRKDKVIRWSRRLYSIGAVFMLVAIVLSMVVNWG